MTETGRPDPDALVRTLAQGAGSERGRLKIFFGAVAGVGKTYAMLDAARAKARAGIDVLVGCVETHARPETEGLLAGLPMLPRRRLPYRGHELEEFDLDAALARRPALVLVDELAHTNAPGSRHGHRWRDVEELLAAGIDVFTTLNVQHLESLNDVVARVTGIAVRETVPDRVVETADDVELIDLPPDELLQRLAEGKVYLPEQAERAAALFFRKPNLVALREMALRVAADRVDDEMETYRRASGGALTWPVTDRVMVCISASPSATRVVRAGRRLARRLRAEWCVVYVEQPRHFALPERDRNYARDALRAAERLGAEAVTLAGTDAAAELVAFARARNVTKLVVGKPGTFWWTRDLLRGGFVSRMLQASAEIDVIVVHPGPPIEAHGRSGDPAPQRTPWIRYASAAAIVATCTLAAHSLAPHVHQANLVLLLLVGVVLSAVTCGRGPSILASLLAVGAFDFFFVPPHFRLTVDDPQYLLTFAVMLLVGLTMSTLVARLAAQVAVARRRERRTHALLALSRDLAACDEPEEMAARAARRVSENFDAPAALFVRRAAGGLDAVGGAPAAPFDAASERAVADWVAAHGEPAGAGTETLAGAQALYLPLAGARGTFGVLGVRAAAGGFEADRVHLLETFAAQVALALERGLSAAEVRAARESAAQERLRSGLLAAVSHDIRTPLAAIAGAASSLVESGARLDDGARAELAATIHEEAQRMARLAGDLLDLGRLSAGTLPLQRDWFPAEELIGAALHQVESRLGGRPVQLAVPGDLPLAFLDGALIEQLLVNLLDNAARYAPPDTAIEIGASAAGERFALWVADAGPGVVPEERERIFEPFERGTTGRAAGRGGLGLGLAICRAIAEAHGGTIRCTDGPQGGALFRVELPNGPPPADDAAMES